MAGRPVKNTDHSELSDARRPGRRRFPPSILFALLGSLSFLVLWELGAFLALVPPYILPAPSRIFEAALRNHAILLDSVLLTSFEAVLGLGLSILLAVPGALVLHGFPRLGKALYPLLLASQTVPLIALAPLLILWFGFGLSSKVVVVVLACFFPLLVSTFQGLGAVDEDIVRLFGSFGAKKTFVAKKVSLPTALPFAVGGLKIAATYSVGAAVIGEWLGGSGGLGVFMIRSQKSYRIEALFAGIFLIALLTFLLYLGAKGLERLVLPWQNPGSLERRRKILEKKLARSGSRTFPKAESRVVRSTK